MLFIPLFNSSLVLDHYEYEAEGLENGECGLRIVLATAEDEGEWTCVAKLQGSNHEGQDFIRLTINGMQIKATIYQPIKSLTI
jgi:hypothetical protein